MPVALDTAIPGFTPLAPPSPVMGAAPGAGNAFVGTDNDGYHWQLQTVIVTLTPSADVATRYLRVEYRDLEDNVFVFCGAEVGVAASTTTTFCLTIWQPDQAWPIGTNLVVAPLSPFLLQPGWDFRIIVENVQATDTLTAIRYTVQRFTRDY